jgi:putative ABC transport system permease protein
VKFLSLPVKNLRSHRVRSVLTSLGIAIALGGMLALVGLSRGVERNWVMFLEGKGTQLLALRKGAIDAMTAALDEDLGGRIRSVPGIARVTPGLGDMVDLETGEMAYILGWPLDDDIWRTLQMTEGTTPGPGEPEGIVLGETLAGHLARRPGDSLQLSGRDFKIVGVSRQPSVLEDRAVMMPMAAMQRLLGREGKVSGFHLRFRHPDNVAETGRIRSQLAAMFPQMSFVETSEVARDTLVLRLLRAIAWSSSTIAMGMAFMAVMNSLLMSVSERTGEIGLLCAIGWSPSRIIAMVMLDGLLVSTGGAAAGIGLGLACLRWIARQPRLGGLFQPEVTSGLVLDGAAMAILVGLLAGVYPAWRATRLSPMDLLRSE